MPIISSVGARSRSVRAVYTAIYVVLILGAITMVYPFLLMLSGSMKSEADSHLITPYPEFWFNKDTLFQKYCESKYNSRLNEITDAWNTDVAAWWRTEIPEPVREMDAEDFRAWREQSPDARLLGVLGHADASKMLPRNARQYRAFVRDRYDGDIAAYRADTGALSPGWAGVIPPAEIVGRYRNRATRPKIRELWSEYRTSAPIQDFFYPTPEGRYRLQLKNLPAELGTASDLPELPRFAPPATQADGHAREIFSWFIREKILLTHVRLAPEAESAYRAFMQAQFPGGIDVYNRAHDTKFVLWEDIPFPRTLDEAAYQRVEWEAFLKAKTPDGPGWVCDTGWLEVYGPAQRFDDWRRKKLGRTDAELKDAAPFTAIAAATDRADCLADARALRREFSARNYRHVIEYVAAHGNGILNTVIYCALAVVTALLVNPLAAYALSRFKLPGTYKILLFCMATMAFPGEVSMIPSFLLMKRFPLLPIAGGVGALILAYALLSRVKMRDSVRMMVSLVVALFVGAVVVPMILGPGQNTVSLLNTFAALILPGAASGYFIFLLKGFFDSLPRELYEAADLDGAGEWTKFWTITMTLSRPILAVIALGAFTGAYSAFMMALIIIPDESMWTLMVWIFQLQSYSHGSVVYASLVIAAIPTFLIFAFCQNIIIRGIVVPTEK